MTPKHFEVILKAKDIEFTYKCKTPLEVFTAIGKAVEAGLVSNEFIDFNRCLSELPKIYNGGISAYMIEDKYFRIRYVDGEV